jgi:hypothetical protein
MTTFINEMPITDSEYFYRALESWRADHPEFADIPLAHMALSWLSQILERAQILKTKGKL